MAGFRSEKYSPNFRNGQFYPFLHHFEFIPSFTPPCPIVHWFSFRFLDLKPSACLEFEILRRFNLSSQPDRNGDTLQRRLLLDGVILQQTLQDLAGVKEHITLEVVPYQIIVVVDKEHLSSVNLRSLFTSMDAPTWGLTLISFVATGFLTSTAELGSGVLRGLLEILLVKWTSMLGGPDGAGSGLNVERLRPLSAQCSWPSSWRQWSS